MLYEPQEPAATAPSSNRGGDAAATPTSLSRGEDAAATATASGTSLAQGASVAASSSAVEVVVASASRVGPPLVDGGAALDDAAAGPGQSGAGPGNTAVAAASMSGESRFDRLAGVTLVVLDEVHYLSDVDRCVWGWELEN